MVTKIQPMILRVIREIIDERKKKNVEPALAIEQEILTRMTRFSLMALKELEKDNVIGSHLNINQRKLYYINDSQGKEMKKYLDKKGGKL